jgi:uncharacterized protein (TIRG00374 family)
VSPALRRAITAVRVLVAFGLVILVASFVRFRDRHEPPEGESRVGKILSASAAADRAEFQFEDGTVADVPFSEVRPGIVRIFASLDLVRFSLALVVLLVALAVTFYRWHILMRAVEIDVPLSRTIRLSLIGLFFNNLVPGSTGGDVVRAFYVARSEQKRTRGVVSVMMDRIIGLTALAFMAGLVSLFRIDDPRLGEVLALILLIDAGIVVVTVVFYSKRLRRMLLLDRLFRALPFQGVMREIDHALLLYRYKKGVVARAFVLSFVGQVLFVLNNALIGEAIGIECSFTTYLVLVPIAGIVSAVPLLPGGWGLGEFAYTKLFSYVGVGANEAVSLSALYRLGGTLWGLLGGLALAFSRERVSLKEAENSLDAAGGAESPLEAGS